MIAGRVTEDDIPVIEVAVGDQQWQAIIDTGFNGALELPVRLRPQVNARPRGRVVSILAANQQIEEDVFLVDFPFDGQTMRVEATFVESQQILIGMRLLRDYRITIDCPARSVAIEKQGV